MLLVNGQMIACECVCGVQTHTIKEPNCTNTTSKQLINIHSPLTECLYLQHEITFSKRLIKNWILLWPGSDFSLKLDRFAPYFPAICLFSAQRFVLYAYELQCDIFVYIPNYLTFSFFVFRATQMLFLHSKKANERCVYIFIHILFRSFNFTGRTHNHFDDKITTNKQL